MASHFRDINRSLSRLLTEQARAIGVFDHPTAKGDGREDLLRRFLAERVGTTFGVSKAEVVDSNGGTSGELDIVIFEQSVASCLNVHGERRIVRAEAVAVTIEVKSNFQASGWAAEHGRVRHGIGSLRRYYRPAPLLDVLRAPMPPDSWVESEATFRSGLSTLEDHLGIPAVISAYFGFDGPSEEAIKSFIETPLLDAVCVLGKYTVAKKRPGFKKGANGTEDALGHVWGRGDDALGAFLQVIEVALSNVLAARAFVHPRLRYYLPPGADPTSESDAVT
ncbi:DUF6602 domain-containing protein [Sorangium sp. So ce327]|uniref:DUF6602 domain-containing protein n=1 Tax=Sorangium sp. So ce327 TaxID=3133301 RepID=UPI003F5EF5B5